MLAAAEEAPPAAAPAPTPVPAVAAQTAASKRNAAVIAAGVASATRRESGRSAVAIESRGEKVKRKMKKRRTIKKHTFEKKTLPSFPLALLNPARLARPTDISLCSR